MNNSSNSIPMNDRIIKDLRKMKDDKKAKILANYFKTGKGEYAEGDVFWGISVPKQRIVAKKYSNLSLKDIAALLNSKIHEHRLTALIILVNKYRKSQEADKETIFNLYLQNTKYINNWDLVDLSAPYIVGPQLRHKGKSILITLARSQNVWERRIAIIATFDYIRVGHFKTALRISEILINDKHDLIQKAVGWMLREVGKKNRKVLEDFLNSYAKEMPRTMLRYAIEKFDAKTRLFYLKNN